MSSRTLRRRVHRPDVDGKRYDDNYEISDSLNEPLLGNRDYDDDDDRHSEGQAPTDLLDDERSKEHRHWALLFSHLIAQWAQWLVIGKWRCNLRTFLLRIDPITLKDLAGLLLKFHVCHDLICHNLDGSKTCLYRAFNISNHILRKNVIKYIIRTKSSRIASEKQICRSHVPNFIWSIRKSGANIVVGPWSLIGRLLPNFSGNQNGANRILPPVLLSPLQEERLEHLKQRLAVPFDGTSSEHQDALRQLWRLAYPDRQLPSLKSELWKEMGWQGSDPSTDFRGGGFISLENLIFFAKAYPEAFQNLLHKRDGDRSEWEYPFAVAGINISFMLVQMLDLQSGKPSTMAGQRFLEVLSQDEMAFDNLFCVAFKMLDAQWLVKHASYMQFNDVLKSTRAQLERELALEDVSTVRDLPAYNLLKT